MTDFEDTGGQSLSSGSRLTRLLSGAGKARKWSVLGAVLLSSAAAQAKIIYVNQALTATGNGTTWAAAYKDLQKALTASAAGDSIYVAKGVYYPDELEYAGGDREISFVLKGVKVYGGFAGNETSLGQRNIALNETVLSGEIWQVHEDDPDTAGFERYWSLHVVIASANSTLDGITVQKGSANGEESPANRGGGIYAASGITVTLNNCLIQDNQSADSGGGIWGKVVATNTIFQGNFVNNEHLFTHNPAPRPHNWLFSPFCSGGAIFGDVAATKCQFIDNEVDAQSLDRGVTSSATGGAIAGATVALESCTFDGNIASSLSAYYIKVSSNADATSRGGAVSATTLLTALHCNFINNRAEAYAQARISGGEDYSKFPSSGYTATAVVLGGAIAGQLHMANCLFSNNTAYAMELTGDNSVLDALGAGAYVEGTTDVTNCVFSANNSTQNDESDLHITPTNPPRASLAGGGGLHVANGTTILMNSTFVDNNAQTILYEGSDRELTVESLGDALSTDYSDNTDASLKILTNVFWDTGENENLIFIGGRARISNRLYPTPSTETINILKGSGAGVITNGGANTDFGDPPSRTLVDKDPLFADATNPIGPDGKWGTLDDGLRILAGSPAIGKGNLLFFPKDIYDLDDDGKTNENLPVDFGGFKRIQGGTLDLGAYEFGDVSNSPDISIEQPAGTPLLNAANTVDFGANGGQTKTFVIRNTGAGDLLRLVVDVTGTTPGDYIVTQPISTQLLAAGSTTFTVTFRPHATGPRNATIRVSSNDPDENPFRVNVTGNAPLPDIIVQQPVGTNLTDGSSKVDYGVVGAQSSAVKTFTISNNGIANLNIEGINFTGTNAANFKASAPLQTVVAVGASTTFNVTFTPGGPGPKTANLNILSNDPDDESTFTVKMVGSGTTSPEIAISQPFSPDLVDGNTVSFGSVQKGQLLSKEFVIRNDGTENLTGLALKISGAKVFTATKLSVSSLKPGKTTSFTVKFKPTAAGKQTAKIKIASNDADENPFDLNFSGTGVTQASKKKKASLAAVANTLVAPSSVSIQTPEGAVSTVKDADGSKYLVLTAKKPADGSKVTVEVSSNLVDWYSGANHTTTLVDNATTLQVRDDTPVQEGTKRYIRVK
jgi:hypothetical protein